MWRCGLAPHTLALFKTKIADFPSLFKTEFRFLIRCLRHLTRNHTLCKTIINIETLSYFIHWQSQNYLQLDQQSHEDLVNILLQFSSQNMRAGCLSSKKRYHVTTKIAKIDALIKTKNDKIDKTKIQKNIPWLVERPH